MGVLSSSFRIARVWGIPIRIHISLVFTLLLFIQEFGLVAGILVEAGFAASIILHELGHSLVAIRKGYRVRQIDLLFIGGAAVMDRMPIRPFDEFLMAIAGPAVSLVLGVTGIYAGNRLPIPPLVGNLNIIHFLGVANIGLLLFNLLPAFPMDGGRVVRALLARRMGRLRATFIAARLGKVLAVLLGLSAWFGLRPVVAPRSWGLLAIAFFVFIAAGHEYQLVRQEEAHASGAFDGGDDDGDAVVVGPPPYRRTPPTRTEIRSADDTPFEDPFGR
jgi:Zn-dependent protease